MTYSRLSLAILLSLAAVSASAKDWQGEGRTSMAQGEPGKAVSQFAEAARANPFDPSALNNQAVALAAQGDHQSALQLLERASKLAPNRNDIAVNLAELRTWLDRKASVPVTTPSQSYRSLRRPSVMPPEPPPLWQMPTR